MKTILLLMTSDRFSMPLIRYLVLEGKRYGWKTCVASMFDNTFVERIKSEKISNDLIFISITDFRQCDHAVRKSDIVIGMVPDVMLLQVADSCIAHRKPLISPGRLNRQLFAKKAAAEENKSLILVECGFAPGMDHVTAKNVIDTIHAKKGTISSFKTYSGSLIAESCIDNPWEFKLTESVSDLIHLGKGNNRYLYLNQHQQVQYPRVFRQAQRIEVPGIRQAVVIPEDDAMYCKKVYDLNEAHTVMRGKILRDGFDKLWSVIIELGLTNDTSKVELFDKKTFYRYMRSLVQYNPEESFDFSLRRQTGASYEDIEKLRWLGLFDEEWLSDVKHVTPALILQYLMEKKLSMNPEDKDCIVMQHDLEYATAEFDHRFRATLMVQGEDATNAALAKAIGLTTGAAAKGVLLDNIKVKGIHTPVIKEIYEPILGELVEMGVAFHVEERKWRREEANAALISFE